MEEKIAANMAEVRESIKEAEVHLQEAKRRIEADSALLNEQLQTLA